MKVELIYDHDCPNIESARTQLVRAFAQAKSTPTWTEWERSQPESPTYVQGYGSPTILVNSQDVAGVPEGEGSRCCRVYTDTDGAMHGVPALDTIVQALTASQPKPTSLWKRFLAVLPVIGAVVLPKLTCPACWPAYAALLSGLGLGFINYTPYLFPMTLGFLAIVLISLAYRAQTRRGFGPLWFAVSGSSILLAGKFLWVSDVVLYGGLAIVIAASIWNAWPLKADASCNQCQHTKEGKYETPHRNL